MNDLIYETDWGEEISNLICPEVRTNAKEVGNQEKI